MKKILKKISIFICIFFITACASAGKEFDMNAVDSFIPGQTTSQEIIAKLGKPISITKLNNGDSILGWSFAKSTPLGTKSRSVTIQFDSQEIMKKTVSKVEL